jgi:type I restriction enzyme S subunit
MEVKPGYKQSELGVIPDEWDVTSLGKCLAARPSYGINAPAVPYSDKLPVYIRITDITEDGRFIPDKRVSVKSELSGNYHLSDGDLVFARTGASVGKSYRYNPNDGPLVYAGFLIRVRPDGQKLLPAFAAAYVTTGNYWRWVRLMSMRSGQPGINGNEYSQLPIPLPPPTEQRVIAGALSDVDGLLDGLERLIAKKRDVKQAAMQQLLTGQTRLPGFYSGWEMKTLHEVCEKIQDGTHFSPKLGGNDYLYVTSKNIRVGTLDLSTAGRISTGEHLKIYARCDVKRGDLLLTKDGANTGNAALNTLDEPFSLLSSVALLRFDCRRHAAAYFLYQILSNYGQQQIKEAMSGNAITRLTLVKIRALRFPVAPIEEQTAIAEVLMDMDAELAALEQRRAKTRALKQAMMRELLTGKTRLV